MMASTSKSNRRKSRKSKFPSKPKQEWRVKQQKRNWLELPSDVMANILYRVGVYDILENAQKVCTTWRKICKDPAMWRVIHMENHSDPCARPQLREMCKHAVDRSQGQLVDLTIEDFANDELLEYIADRSSQLRRLNIDYCFGSIYETLTESVKKFPLLEELIISQTDVSKEDIESAGRYCPKLRTLKLIQKAYKFSDDTDEEFLRTRDEIAIAIGENIPELRHLELIGDTLSNIGLQSILDGCRHLELLDLRQCFYIDLEGDMGKKCSERIKCLKLPNDSLDGDYPYLNRNDDEPCECGTLSEDFVSGDSDYEYDEYFDYDDFTNPYKFALSQLVEDIYDPDDDDFEDMEDMLAFMSLFG